MKDPSTAASSRYKVLRKRLSRGVGSVERKAIKAQLEELKAAHAKRALGAITGAQNVQADGTPFAQNLQQPAAPALAPSVPHKCVAIQMPPATATAAPVAIAGPAAAQAAPVAIAGPAAAAAAAALAIAMPPAAGGPETRTIDGVELPKDDWGDFITPEVFNERFAEKTGAIQLGGKGGRDMSIRAGRNTTDGTAVAISTSFKNDFESKAEAEAYIKEAAKYHLIETTLKHHDNVCTIYAWSFEKSTAGSKFAVSLMAAHQLGTPLKGWLAKYGIKNGPYVVPPATAMRRFFKQAIAVAAECERQGISNRDMKPENFIISEDSAEGNLLVIDWDTAIRHDDFQGDNICDDYRGTPTLLPFDFFYNKNMVGPDITGLALALLAMFVGYNPWCDQYDRVDKHYKHLPGKIEDLMLTLNKAALKPPCLTGEMDENLYSLISLMMEFDIESRITCDMIEKFCPFLEYKLKCAIVDLDNEDFLNGDSSKVRFRLVQQADNAAADGTKKLFEQTLYPPIDVDDKDAAIDALLGEFEPAFRADARELLDRVFEWNIRLRKLKVEKESRHPADPAAEDSVKERYQSRHRSLRSLVAHDVIALEDWQENLERDFGSLERVPKEISGWFAEVKAMLAIVEEAEAAKMPAASGSGRAGAGGGDLGKDPGGLGERLAACAKRTLKYIAAPAAKAEAYEELTFAADEPEEEEEEDPEALADVLESLKWDSSDTEFLPDDCESITFLWEESEAEDGSSSKRPFDGSGGAPEPPSKTFKDESGGGRDPPSNGDGAPPTSGFGSSSSQPKKPAGGSGASDSRERGVVLQTAMAFPGDPPNWPASFPAGKQSSSDMAIASGNLNEDFSKFGSLEKLRKVKDKDYAFVHLTGREAALARKLLLVQAVTLKSMSVMAETMKTRLSKEFDANPPPPNLVNPAALLAKVQAAADTFLAQLADLQITDDD